MRKIGIKDFYRWGAWLLCLLSLSEFACSRQNPPQKEIPPSAPKATAESPPALPSPQVESSFPKDFFSVNGISLWSSQEAVIKKIGPPMKTKRWGEKDSMMPGQHLKLDYSGLSLDFYKDPPKDYYIWKMEVTGKNWSVSPGIQVGMELKEVENKLKSLNLQRDPEDNSMSACGLMDGTDVCIWIKFKDHIVTELGILEDWS